MYCLYRHIRLDTELPFYVGIGKLNKHRCNRAYVKHNRSDEWKEIVKHFGYRVEVIYYEDNLEDIYEKEKEFIFLYKEYNLVNKTKGGGGILGHKVSEDTKKRLSEVNTGKNHPQYGTKASYETREKQSLSKRGARNTNSVKCICVQTSEVFNSFGEAARKLYNNESKHKKISDIIKGRRKTHLGLSFKLYEK